MAIVLNCTSCTSQSPIYNSNAIDYQWKDLAKRTHWIRWKELMKGLVRCLLLVLIQTLKEIAEILIKMSGLFIWHMQHLNENSQERFHCVGAHNRPFTIDYSITYFFWFYFCLYFWYSRCLECTCNSQSLLGKHTWRPLVRLNRLVVQKGFFSLILPSDSPIWFSHLILILGVCREYLLELIDFKFPACKITSRDFRRFRRIGRNRENIYLSNGKAVQTRKCTAPILEVPGWDIWMDTAHPLEASHRPL